MKDKKQVSQASKESNSLLQNPYLPGIAMFIVALVVGLLTYHDYGIGWDEPAQRGPGILSYDYIMHGSKDLFIKKSDNHGAGFEILLAFIEKGFNINDSRNIYLMRHIVSHVFFLVSVLAGYVLLYRLFKDRFIASLGFLMLALMPRIYAHSFFNSKDVPFLAMIIIVMMLLELAFSKNKAGIFLLLGLATGYATSIRIMGVMLALFIVLFLVADAFFKIRQKEKINKELANAGLFTFGFILLLYLPWPYLWKDPINMFFESFSKMSHYAWNGALLFQGQIMHSDKPLPWTYFPTWFMISIPELWLIVGFIGMGLLGYDMYKRPLTYIQNTTERIFLFILLCFWVPIISVIFLQSVIYDDWRHLYFVYPSFVFIGLYFVHKLLKGKFVKIVQGVCALQVLLLLVFMVRNHPFNQVYFNNLVSHDEEYLRKNYDMEYWGLSFAQGLQYLAENDTSRKINICCEYTTPLDNNIMFLKKEDRGRFAFSQFQQADYFMSVFRMHPDDYPGTNIVYEVQVLNSTIFRVYKLKENGKPAGR